MSETDRAEGQTEAELIAELDAALGEMLRQRDAWRIERKALQAELAEAKDQLKIVFEGNVGYGVLREIARDPTIDPKVRAKCAEALFQTERPKLSAVLTHTAPAKLFDILERAKSQGKIIEQAPAPDPAA